MLAANSKRSHSASDNPATQIPSPRILRFDEVRKKTGLCRSYIHQLVADGRFPRPLKLVPGGRASGFLESEVNAWIAERVAERDGIKGAA